MDRESTTSHSVLERILLDESAEPTNLPLSLLEDITNRFSLDHRIGSGGFAVVYKGLVGKGMVAVKKLSNTFSIHEDKFQEEVRCLIKAKHKNIVRFLGYCAETQGKMEEYGGNLVMADQRNWLLCFEYVCNGSLDKHITDASCGLNWMERYRIIRGMCEGLLFLHEKRIIHLDIKPANILLDGHMVPKICDFGISRCLGEEQTHVVTKNQCGTLGYMDLEYLRSGRITFASDIYSLGAIIAEILTGARGPLKEENVVESWMNRLEASERGMQLEPVRVCTEIAVECGNPDPKKRPEACHIIDRLDKMASADYSYETGTSSSLAELHAREQLGERIGKLAAENLCKADVEECHEILEDSSGRVQNTKQKENNHGVSILSSISTVFNKLNNLDIFNRKAAHTGFDRNSVRLTLEQSVSIKIFRKDELKPILSSSNLIGRTSWYAKVYKGVLDNAQVTVKKLISGRGEFANVVIIQSQVIHKNIVRFIGCCLEMDSPILVYEFIPGGSLHDILYSDRKVPLSLDVRLTIAAETAQGLAYLHSQARIEILHGEVQPSHIMLDRNFTPKITGFDLRWLSVTEHTNFAIGDVDYMDPVYMKTGLLTEKSDVYSFGIVILELISRKKPSRPANNNLVRSFLEVHEEGKKATKLFDKEIAVTAADLEILDCLAEIAMECIDLDVDKRPTMIELAAHLVILNRSHRSTQVICR